MLSLFAVVAAVLLRTALVAPPLFAVSDDLPARQQASAVPVLPSIDEAARRLSRAITFRTVTQEDRAIAPEPFRALRDFLRESFPRVHGGLQREIVGEHSLLFVWPGSDSTLKPALLLAHMDVVPADADNWTRPPFSGAIADGFIWGRGALDNKVSVLAILEAAEALLAAGFQPRRSLYFAFGHDEEIGGNDGARRMAELLAERGLRFELVLEEGMVITEGVVAGISSPLAAVGVAEKGYLTVKLSARSPGGHSSMPPRHTAVSLLSTAVAALHRHPLPGQLDGAARDMLAAVAREMPFMQRMAIANLWLMSPLVERMLARSPATDALIRTTTAATMISGGSKENVLPDHAFATVNFRIKPGDTRDRVLTHVREVIADERIKIAVLTGLPASPVVGVNSPAFQLLGRTIRQVFPDVLIAPGLVPVTTDSKHYRALSEGILRFVPMRMGPADLRRLHGVDERIGVTNYGEIIQFYVQLMHNLN
ncbi:MAG: M20 family peptidase [Proteobacteria bacterium]|nr:M20 family peptidase [Pseudomonadota bacterium]